MPIKKNWKSQSYYHIDITFEKRYSKTIWKHEKIKEIIDKPPQRSAKFSSSLQHKDLMSLLQYEMHGIQ